MSCDLSWNDYISDEGYNIATAIRQSKAIAVTDASVETRTKTATISWIFTDDDETYHDKGDSGCPTFHNALDSYGAESFGLVFVLTVVKIICDFYRIRSGKIVIACDNDSSLDKCIRTKYCAKPSDTYFDLLWTAFDIRKELKILLKPKIVAGHQEKKKWKLNIFERLIFFATRGVKHFGLRSKMEEYSINPYRLDLKVDTQLYRAFE